MGAIDFGRELIVRPGIGAQRKGVSVAGSTVRFW